MKPIGGYFELELFKDTEYHSDAIGLNTGRNAFEYILMAKNYQKVFLPFYTCNAMLEPIKKLKLEYEFYSIDETFRPIFDFSWIKSGEVFVYTNYFGICDTQVEEIVSKCTNLVIDNSQAFYSKPLLPIDTFYSPRKFFGVPDGGYLYTNKILEEIFEVDNSTNRFGHLIGRIENGAESSFGVFKENEQELCEQPIKKMSVITKLLLQSINYKQVAEIRKSNFQYLHKQLGVNNLLNLRFTDESVPMIYPFLSIKKELRTSLIQNKIYIASFWPNVLDWCNDTSFEYKLTANMSCLPIDQRVRKEDLDRIIKYLQQS